MKNYVFPHIPIDISLGGDVRECLVLALLALVPLLYRAPAAKRRECVILCGAMLLVALNPWCSRAVAEHTNAVMSWRWIWIAPIPAVTAMLLALSWRRPQTCGALSTSPARCGRAGWAGWAAGAGLTLLFCCSGPWTCVSGNVDFHFSWPQWKLPREYAEVRELAAKLPPANEGLVVLAPARQAAWLPVVRPGLPLVMGGHTQRGAYRKLVGRREHADRIAAQSLVEREPNNLSLERLAGLIDTLGITHIIAPRDNMDNEQFDFLRQRRNARVLGGSARFAVIHLP